MRSTTIIELFLYSNAFVHYKCMFMNAQRRQLFEHFKIITGSFSVVSLCIIKETYKLLKSLFTLSRLVVVQTLHIRVSVSYDPMIKCV